MKKSDLKSYIRENIINILSEDLDEKEEQVDRINQKSRRFNSIKLIIFQLRGRG